MNRIKNLALITGFCWSPFLCRNGRSKEAETLMNTMWRHTSGLRATTTPCRAKLWADGTGEWGGDKGNPSTTGITSPVNHCGDTRWTTTRRWWNGGSTLPWTMGSMYLCMTGTGMKRSIPGERIERRLLKARNNGKMQFYIMWANHDVSTTTGTITATAITTPFSGMPKWTGRTTRSLSTGHQSIFQTTQLLQDRWSAPLLHFQC